MMTRSYLVMYEKGRQNWSGYSPQVPGCVSTGDTLEEMRAMMTEALEFHLGSMTEDGDPIPEAADSTVDFAEETLANGVEYCVVEWLPVRISSEFAGTRVNASAMPSMEEQKQNSGAEIYAGALRGVFTPSSTKHP